MKIQTIDHLEYYVEDAELTAAELVGGYGFVVAGRGDPGTGLRDARSVLLRQGAVSLLVTSALSGAHRAREYVQRHGDGVAVVGLAVDDAEAAFAEAVERGAEPVATPSVLGEAGARVTFASVTGFGDVEHRFTSREWTGGLFAPGLVRQDAVALDPDPLLRTIDHLAVCLPAGLLDPAVHRYREVFDMDQTFEEKIIIGRQAMTSKVVQSASGGVTFTIIEPDTSRASGQIDRFVRDHDGAGVQHVAFLTRDIAAAVGDCSARGVPFLSTPAAYYDALPGRLGDVGVPVPTLQRFNILADRDFGGVMMQIFTQSRHPRGTLFYELIERRGARTFGSNNIKALYEAIERQETAESAQH